MVLKEIIEKKHQRNEFVDCPNSTCKLTSDNLHSQKGSTALK